MHCLYCDRPLALLKRLTGDGEFCSKEHRKIYQKEHNQLALARLLDAQPKGKREDLRHNSHPAPPPPPPPVEKREGRQPGQAGFISDFLREASAVSDAHRSAAGPRFQSAAPVLAESIPAPGTEDRNQMRALPKAARFLSESPALFFSGEVRFPGSSAPQPLAGRPRLGELRRDFAGIAIRLQPGRVGFISGQPLAPACATAFASAKERQPSGPRFRPMVPARTSSGISRSGSDPKLPLAAHIPPSAAWARSIPDRVRSLAAEPRWQPLAAAVPTRPMGKIILVVGSFLRRPVRIANQDSLPESFEIRFRPISFPRYAPRMGILEERPHGVDRIGITPP